MGPDSLYNLRMLNIPRLLGSTAYYPWALQVPSRIGALWPTTSNATSPTYSINDLEDLYVDSLALQWGQIISKSEVLVRVSATMTMRSSRTSGRGYLGWEYSWSIMTTGERVHRDGWRLVYLVSRYRGYHLLIKLFGISRGRATSRAPARRDQRHGQDQG